MIFGRPTNVWNGFVLAAVGFLTVLAIDVFKLDPVTVAKVAGSATALLGAIVVVIAGAPPIVSPGGTVQVHTPNGDPNATAKLTIAPSGQVEVVDRRHQ